jgi:hypothetical protein
MSKNTAPVCPADGGRLLDWNSRSSDADYMCPATHGSLGKPLFFRTVWEGVGVGSTYSIEPLPGQDIRKYTPHEQKEAADE